MQRYGEVIGEVAEREIASWPVGEPLALAPRMQALTLEVIMRAVFGIEDAGRLEELRGRLTSLLDWTTRPSRLIRLAAVGPGGMSRLRELREALGPVHAVVLAEIARRREDPEGTGGEDILSLLVQARYEDGRPMSDEELRDELMTLLVAGHETTATALSWAAERLVRHPQVLERLTDEVLAGDEEYVDAVAKETLRLRPVLPIVLRRLAEPMEIGGWSLPAGVRVAPCIYLMHRREDIYPEPRRFRPERFLERPAGTYTWIHFGGGVRRCLGASFALFEMKVVLAALVRATRLRPAAAPAERIRRRAITMAPARGAEIVVAERRATERPAAPLPAEAAA
jgi:cytochrome P450